MSDWQRDTRPGGDLPRRSALWITVLAAVSFYGCGGGIPSIPNDPEQALAKGDRYFERDRYFQAQEIYKGFLQRHPGHPRSDYAQFMLGESYFGDEEWALAAVEYRILTTNYGYSDLVDDAFLKEAVCLYRQSPKPQLDQTKAEEALSRLEQFVLVFPQSPLLPEAQKYISLIHEKLAEKHMKNAYYYYKRKAYNSALIYLDKIIDNFPENEHWVRALYFKGEIREVRGEYEEAVEAYSRVLAWPHDIDVKRKARDGLQRLSQQLQVNKR